MLTSMLSDKPHLLMTRVSHRSSPEEGREGYPAFRLPNLKHSGKFLLKYSKAGENAHETTESNLGRFGTG
jgi:hypothetical protein